MARNRGGSGPPKRERPGLAQPGALENNHTPVNSAAKIQRQERRRREAAWHKNLNQMNREGCGLFRVELLRPGEPNRKPATLLALQVWFDDLEQGVQLRPVCAFCDCIFQWPQILPGALLLFSPDRDVPTHSVICGICREHATSPDALIMEKAFRFVRATIMADARKLNPANIHTNGGRA